MNLSIVLPLGRLYVGKGAWRMWVKSFMILIMLMLLQNSHDNSSLSGDIKIGGVKKFSWYQPGVILVSASSPTGQPTGQPSRQPTMQPTRQPTMQPSRQPTMQPTGQPTRMPTRQPTGKPTSIPSSYPTCFPTGQPSRGPSSQPTKQPIGFPTSQPSRQPTTQPTRQPTRQPTSQPSRQPTGQPSRQPTAQPTRQPSVQPTGQPTRQPTRQPTSQPSRQPTSQPTRRPTMQPTRQPSSQPSMQPIVRPTSTPTQIPTMKPSSQPTVLPTGAPSTVPTSNPTSTPMVTLYGMWTVVIFAVPFVLVIFFATLAECRETRMLNKDLNDKNLMDVDSGETSGKKHIQHKVAELIKDQSLPDLDIKQIAAKISFGSPEDRIKKDREVIKVCYTEIIETLFYGIYSPTLNFIAKIEAELESNHCYFAVFFSKKIGYDRWLLTAKLITSINFGIMLIFILFGYQMPSNDSRCSEYTTVSQCLHTATIFDPQVHYCRWITAEATPNQLSTCSYNNYYSAYTYRALITIIFLVFVIMAPVTTLVEFTFDSVLCAPAYSSTNTLLLANNDSIEQSRHELNLKTAARVKLLRENLKTYRSELDFAGEIEHLNNFDLQWGVYPCDDGDEELLYIDKIVSSMRRSLLNFSKELVFYETMQAESRGLYVLFKFALDLLGESTPTARIFFKKADSQLQQRTPISLPVKILAAVLVLVMNIIAIAVSFLMAAGHIEYWINSVVVAAAIYLIIDILFVEGGKFILLHVAIPNMFNEQATYAYKIMMDCLTAMCERVEIRYGHRRFSFDFSVTDYVYESIALARKFPLQMESAIVLKYRSDFPGLMGVHWRGEFFQNIFNHVSAEDMLGNDANFKFGNFVGIDRIASYGNMPTFVTTWRALTKLLINIYAQFPVALVRFVVHLLMPTVLGGVVGIIWLLIDAFTVAIYVLILVALLFAMSMIIYTSRGKNSSDPTKIGDEPNSAPDFQGERHLSPEEIEQEERSQIPPSRSSHSQQMDSSYESSSNYYGNHWIHNYDNNSEHSGLANSATKATLQSHSQPSSTFGTPRSSGLQHQHPQQHPAHNGAKDTAAGMKSVGSSSSLQQNNQKHKVKIVSPLEMELEKLESQNEPKETHFQTSFAGHTPRFVAKKSFANHDSPKEEVSNIGVTESGSASPIPFSSTNESSAFKPAFQMRAGGASKRAIGASPLIQSKFDATRTMETPDSDYENAAAGAMPMSLEDIQKMKAQLAALEAELLAKSVPSPPMDQPDSDEEYEGKSVTIRIATPPRQVHKASRATMIGRPVQSHRVIVDVNEVHETSDALDSNTSDIPTKHEELESPLLSPDEERSWLPSKPAAEKLFAPRSNVESKSVAASSFLGIMDVGPKPMISQLNRKSEPIQIRDDDDYDDQGSDRDNMDSRGSNAAKRSLTHSVTSSPAQGRMASRKRISDPPMAARNDNKKLVQGQEQPSEFYPRRPRQPTRIESPSPARPAFAAKRGQAFTGKL